ncbi:hypothetical protein BaRGS_00035022 [Batillaria attramentaria]|uniref:Uncharacterized protein n=1 Tax=Batillaria attramentaria TaxID=370345 RepID=A0ABD0JH57_9CAEN
MDVKHLLVLWICLIHVTGTADILNCLWLGEDRPPCIVNPSYSLKGEVTDTLVLEIPSASEEHVGTYQCWTILSGPTDRTSAVSPAQPTQTKIRVKTLPGVSEIPNDENDSGEGSSNAILVVGVSVAVVIMLVVVAIVFVIIIRYRKSKRQRYFATTQLNPDTENGLHEEDHSTVNDDGSAESAPLNSGGKPEIELRFTDSDQNETTPLSGGYESQPETSTTKPSQAKELFEVCKAGDLDKLKNICVSQNVAVAFVRDSDHNTLLHVASRHDRAGVVETLLLYGVDIYVRDKQFRTVMHIASYHGAASVIDVLLKYKMKTDTKDSNGSTPLHLACEKKENEDTSNPSKSKKKSGAEVASDEDSNTRQVDVVKKLLGAGADVRIADAEGQTPLHLACRSGNAAIVKTLLADEGDALSSTSACDVIDVRDTRGQTPFHMACLAGNKEIVQILIDYGADLTVTDENGLTPALLAKKNGHKDIAKQISEHLKEKKKQAKKKMNLTEKE